MESTTAIVTALALGAVAGLKDTAEQIIKDGYFALKHLIKSRFPNVSTSLDQLEEAPDSAARRAVVQEDLANNHADSDVEILQKARALLDLIEQKTPDTAAIVGLDIGTIKAASLYVSDVISSGTGVKMDEGNIKGDAIFEGIRAGQQGNKDPNA